MEGLVHLEVGLQTKGILSFGWLTSSNQFQLQSTRYLSNLCVCMCVLKLSTFPV